MSNIAISSVLANSGLPPGNKINQRPLLSALLLFLLPSLHASAQSPPQIAVDCGKTLGRIRPLHGVNGGPLAAGGILDLSDRFRQFVPPLVRLHDCHWPNPDVVDMHVVFPDPNADPERPESYDFARTDEYVKAIVDSGSGIVFRLGESIEHTKIRKYVHPPKDMDRWAAACLGVIRHYNEGWASGFRYKIRYWEIWNEPDNRPAMWSGTDEDYFRLYATASKAIKNRYPDLLVGGPALGNTGNLKGDNLHPAPFFAQFLDRCRRDSLPLDFLSWHAYTDDASDLRRRAAAVRRFLDEKGFKKTESHLNEWNYLPDNNWSPLLAKDSEARERWHERLGGMEGAVFVARSLILLQDAPLDAANYFSAESQGMGLFNCYGVPKKTFYAFRVFHELARTPLRLSAKSTSSDHSSPLAPRADETAIAFAGMSESKDRVIVLLSVPGKLGKLTVAVDNMPWTEAAFEVAVLDAKRNLQTTRSGRCKTQAQMDIDLPGPAVCLIRFQQDRPREDK